ncbi:MAG: hypothetical protein HYS25_06120, partial [Ignavibacteriales bacterium]|nr:hypothetical protein [Ignavibacteriales bacterium]
MKKIFFVMYFLPLLMFAQDKVNVADSNKAQSGYYVTPYWLQNHSGVISLNQFNGATFKANMDSALAYISTAPRTIRMPVGINSLTENLTIPSNVTLDFTSGG